MLTILLTFTACGSGSDGDSSSSGNSNNVPVSNALEAPKLNFSDLISGPAVGLNDGKGSGVIVTVWGQNLGSSQGNSTLSLTDSQGVEYPPAHIYYWKNADGTAPGGPANLYKPLKMQEIAFSIPNIANGDYKIKVSVNAKTSNFLPFKVRNGAIFHLSSTGIDAPNGGSFTNKWQTLNYAFGQITQPGATLYIHDNLQIGSASSVRPAYWNVQSASSTGYSNQFGVIAYPGSQPVVTGYKGFENFKVTGQVISKIKVQASMCDDVLGQPVNVVNGVATTCFKVNTYGILGTAYGRIIANAITDRPGGCANGQQGAILANANNGNDRISGLKVFGNEVYDYGCEGTNKFHHTTYFSIRNQTNLQVEPWEWGWNYLHDNKAKNGIHHHDEAFNASCGSPSGKVSVHDNVIVNQSGAGIHFGIGGSGCQWNNDVDIYNNLLINTGLIAAWDGVNLTSANGPNTGAITINDKGLTGTFSIFNNTMYKWNDDDQNRNVQSCLGLTGTGAFLTAITFSNNICLTDKDKPFVAVGVDGLGTIPTQIAKLSGSNNLLFSSIANPSKAVEPSLQSIDPMPNINTNPIFTSTIQADPLILFSNSGSYVQSINATSPIIGAGTPSLKPTHDLFGNKRTSSVTIGAMNSF